MGEAKRRGLGISLMDGVDDYVSKNVLGWHPEEGAMVAKFRDIRTGEFSAVSMTYINSEGKKTGHKFVGKIEGAAIMFEPFEDVATALCIGRGLESCLAARQLGLRPVWALATNAEVAAFPVLGGVDQLTIILESEADVEAAEICAARWYEAGREVLIRRSPLLPEETP
jgi:putative DNA primase/helicase